jgi:quercetin dioxygenase-like cupin family protein
MSPVQHRISGAALSFVLADEMERVRQELAKVQARIGRTLVKDGPLRVSLVGLHAGHGLHEHRASGPVTIHVLEGTIEVDVGGARHPLEAGMLLALDAGVVHSVNSRSGGFFLVTVMHGAADDVGRSV